MIAADISFCLGLIGKPWVSGANGPAAFDCWGLLQHAFRERRGVNLQGFAGLDVTGQAWATRELAKEFAGWDEIPAPVHFCAVGMSEGRAVHHVGIWLADGGGGVFHSQRGAGVAFQTIPALRRNGIQNISFYQLKP